MYTSGETVDLALLAGGDILQILNRTCQMGNRAFEVFQAVVIGHGLPSRYAVVAFPVYWFFICTTSATVAIDLIGSLAPCAGVGYTAGAIRSNGTRAMAKVKKQPRPKAETPKGFRDYFGADVTARSEMLQNIAQVYHRYGFDALETSAVETVEALGKFLPDVDRPN